MFWKASLKGTFLKYYIDPIITLQKNEKCYYKIPSGLTQVPQNNRL